MFQGKTFPEELDGAGIRLRRSQGQHFLLDENIAEKQVREAGVSKTDTVLEVGPGLGVLTKVLSNSAGRVIAIEKDERLAEYLAKRVPQNTEVICADAMKVPFPRFDIFVANIPYQISSPLIFKLLDCDFKVAVIMLQLEFAQRLVATPKSKTYSRISIGVKMKCSCEIIQEVPRDVFYPRPRVDSAIVKMVPRPPPVRPIDEDLFHMTVKAAFSHRRKKIHNSLLMEWGSVAKALNKVKEVQVGPEMISKEDMALCISHAPHRESRPEQLDLEQFNEIVEHMAMWFISKGGQRSP